MIKSAKDLKKGRKLYTLKEVERELKKIPGFSGHVEIERAKLHVQELLKRNPDATASERLAASGLVLQEPKAAVGMYKSVLVDGNRLIVSGHGPWFGGKPICGKVGKRRRVKTKDGWQYEQVGFTTMEARNAANHVALGVLASIEAAVGLDRVEQLVKTLGWVNCTKHFGETPFVIDGFSEVMELIFGELHGRGTRSAIGANALPFGIAVEVECEFRLKPEAAVAAA